MRELREASEMREVVERVEGGLAFCFSYYERNECN